MLPAGPNIGDFFDVAGMVVIEGEDIDEAVDQAPSYASYASICGRWYDTSKLSFPLHSNWNQLI